MTQQEFDEWVYVSHPTEGLHQRQKRFLEAAVGDTFEFTRLSLNYGNAAYRYSDLAAGEIGIEDYEEWLEGLPAKIASNFRQKGFEQNKNVLSLRRHALERRDIGMDEFIAGLLRPEDLAAWRELARDDD